MSLTALINIAAGINWWLLLLANMQNQPAELLQPSLGRQALMAYAFADEDLNIQRKSSELLTRMKPDRARRTECS